MSSNILLLRVNRIIQHPNKPNQLEYLCALLVRYHLLFSMECNMNAPIEITTNTIGSIIVKTKASVPSNNSSNNTPITKPTLF